MCCVSRRFPGPGPGPSSCGHVLGYELPCWTAGPFFLCTYIKLDFRVALCGMQVFVWTRPFHVRFMASPQQDLPLIVRDLSEALAFSSLKHRLFEVLFIYIGRKHSYPLQANKA